MIKLGSIFFVLAIFGAIATQSSSKVFNSDELSKAIESDDADLDIRQLIEKYGYNGETHRVITEDGYVLEIHRITGSKQNSSAIGKPPILMMHQYLGSSDDWIISGPEKAFGYVLADEGYDVWLGNVRGNKFCRKHMKYTSVDKEFWQFSWHETGMYDLPATIDYILEKSKTEKLTYVAHSEGNAAFWIMAAERPIYQKKIKAVFSLAPIAYMNHNTSPFYRVLELFQGGIEKLSALLGQYEFEPTNRIVVEIAKEMCKDKSLNNLVCSNVMFIIGGSSDDQLNATMVPTILAHAPAGGSVKQLIHLLQIIRARKFQNYDYGLLKNLVKYKRPRPPIYSLSRVQVPVYLWFSSGDRVADPTDVDRLYGELGNSMGKFRVIDEKFTHLDFMWGKDARIFIYDKIVSQIAKYNV